VIGFTDDEDAGARDGECLARRSVLASTAWTIHPDKTRLVPFRKPPRRAESHRTETARERSTSWGSPMVEHALGRETGFCCGRRRADRSPRGGQDDLPVVPVASPRPDRGTTQDAVPETPGHAAYYGITGNSPALALFYHEVLKVWRKWLTRRRRAWGGSWSWFRRLLDRHPVPYLRVVHSVYHGVAKG